MKSRDYAITMIYSNLLHDNGIGIEKIISISGYNGGLVIIENMSNCGIYGSGIAIVENIYSLIWSLMNNIRDLS